MQARKNRRQFAIDELHAHRAPEKVKASQIRTGSLDSSGAARPFQLQADPLPPPQTGSRWLTEHAATGQTRRAEFHRTKPAAR